MTAPRAREQSDPPSPPDRRPPRRGGGSSPSIYAASAAGRRIPPVARHGLVRSARALAVAALLALSGALVLPATAQADVLVSNIGQATASTSINPEAQDNALQFTTGGNTGGYNLDSVELKVKDYENVMLTVSLYSDSSGVPGSSIFTFTNPTSGITANANNTFTAPANTTLMASTPYHIVVSGANDPDERGARQDCEELRNVMFSLRYLFPVSGYRWRQAWRPAITTTSPNSAASSCESLRTSATSVRDHSGLSTASAASPTATARARARRDTAHTGC